MMHRYIFVGFAFVLLSACQSRLYVQRADEVSIIWNADHGENQDEDMYKKGRARAAAPCKTFGLKSTPITYRPKGTYTWTPGRSTGSFGTMYAFCYDKLKLNFGKPPTAEHNQSTPKWSPNPLIFERHLQRRHNNRLFKKDRRRVNQVEIDASKAKDSAIAKNLNTRYQILKSEYQILKRMVDRTKTNPAI